MKPDFLTSSFVALRNKLHRCALSLLHNEDDALDALQDTYCRLRLKPEPQSDDEARYKLFAVLHNICIDQLRRNALLRNETIEENSASVEPSSADDPQRLQTLLMSGLTDIQRKIVAMVANEQMEYDQIARELNMTEGAVRTALCRARMKMRENYNILEK
ncbi:MAG: RNA polymerase sigma factor [Bacteroidales bacterium]|nr:RNA polymerase sigma factor [Bacteroidales bacterium]